MHSRSTEVLVVGGGAAGLCAALAARAVGAEVLLISKSEIGVENCTAYAWGALSGSFGDLPAREYLQTLLEKGGGLNHRGLARILAEHSGPVVEALRAYGVELETTRGHVRVHARPFRAGEGLTLPLLDRADELGCEHQAPVMLAAVEYTDDLRLRAHLIDLAEDAESTLECRALILATGGAAGCFARTDNPGRTTGDAWAVALTLGAQLVDAEFLQIYPLGICQDGLPFDGCNVGRLFQVGRLKTPEGEPINRTQLDARWREVANSGEYDPARYDLWLDLTEVEPSTWDTDQSLRQIRELILGDFPVQEQPLRCSPLAHYTPGGVAINTRCASLAPGLFVAGEAAGGTFGAARPSGGALSDAVVFGALAGREAAEWVREGARPGEWEPPPSGGFATAAERPADEVLAEVRDVLWSLGSIYRCRTGLEECLRRLGALRAQIAPDRGPPRERAVWREAANCVLAGEAMVQAALLREESRGEHRRLDFPDTSPDWNANICVRVEQGGVTHCCKIPLPAAHETFRPHWRP